MAARVHDRAPALADRPLLGYTLHRRNIPTGPLMAGADLRLIEERHRRCAVTAPWTGRTSCAGSPTATCAAARPSRPLRAYAAAIAHDPAGSLRRALRAALRSNHGPRTGYRSPPDQQWRAEAEAWLAPLRREWAAVISGKQ